MQLVCQNINHTLSENKRKMIQKWMEFAILLEYSG